MAISVWCARIHLLDKRSLFLRYEIIVNLLDDPGIQQMHQGIPTGVEFSVLYYIIILEGLVQLGFNIPGSKVNKMFFMLSSAEQKI